MDRGGDEILLGFTRALRAAGVPVTQDRAQGYLAATGLLGLDDQRAAYLAGRATLCAGPDDLERYDQVFAAYFNSRDGLPRSRPAQPSVSVLSDLPTTDGTGAGEGDEDPDVVRAMASELEVLRHRDVAGLSAGEKRRLDAMFATLRPRPPLRRTARHQRWHRGQVDASRTLRASLRRMGEPADIAWRRRGVRPRRVVLLVDVSGSMSGYADALLRLAHRFTQTGRESGGVVETFTVGTRLTHLTRAMRIRDPERALVAAGETVPDWSGGTRLGETLRFFLDRWGQRGMARGAVVVVFSDGWERGDPTLLGEQMARLQRVAHRVVWVNPHRGKTGYEPVQQGVVAALPHCDDFVAGHSLATFAELVEVVSRA
ncbi:MULTISPECIES: vWA domain-containing protein [unclassified Nocardioides]|uniref:vWA domain-containing protein n=1 Tax=unclassified Nocardioides TaxID=2615069 RepID=UPI0009F0DB09|nr:MULTISPECIES: VWA domain-containing protein [unclassified Nocardioides]GAW50763.1 VWA containing CoxE family protein [Nocardioides sp. PD653-B2]GAW55502.1 VWA containing CoxE family protein [Nocardioides sp. PD653]